MNFNAIDILFIVSVFIVFYSYAGYGILLYIYLKLFSSIKKPYPANFYPPATLIVAAYNEHDFIEKKISNSLSLKYPKDRLSLIFITDGSTDGTQEIVRKYSEIKLLHQNERQGKTAALNRAMTFVNTPIVIFTDANTLLNENSVLEITRHYYNEEVGGVAGEKKIISNSASSAEAGEGIYWKY